MTIFDDLPAAREMPTAHAVARQHAIETQLPQLLGQQGPHRGRVLSVAAASAAVATAAVIAAVNPWSSTPAYASWTAVPDQLDRVATQQLGITCAKDLQRHFNGSASGLTAALAERRGQFQAVLLQGVHDGGTSMGVCVNTHHGDLGGLTSVLAPLTAGQVIMLDGNPGQTSGPDAARVAYGRTSTAVARVVVTTQDNRTVTASAGGGYFLAWWPSGPGVSAVSAYAANGRELVVRHYPAASTGAPQQAPR